ncbi:MAG: class I SAM-dependent methyltransferase [Planctomycetes bacterium]|nr:class I SAM-dependent methyltransferase [Planctomycetota bacterium]
MRPSHFVPEPFPDYELLDSGAGEKLERFGPVTLRRPDPQALWLRRQDEHAWNDAHLAFERDAESGGKRGTWRVSRSAPQVARGANPEWTIAWRGARCLVRPTPFKHVGVFPEQATNWSWLAARANAFDVERPRLLNLFGYTGTASIVAAQAGYAVTHVDASKTSLAWLKDNARASGLADDAVRIVLEDALAYVRREVRRGSRYHAIVLDPPHFGRGPKGETWQFEEHLAPLFEALGKLLESRAVLVLSAYAFGTSPLALANLLESLPDGEVEAGELALTESGAAPRLLPCGFCARFARGVASS